MSWSDGLERITYDGKVYIGASYKGVSFFVESTENAGGRRVVENEFPYRDDGWADDMGKANPRFSITGYVIGESVIANLKRLEDALNAAGPGELVDPYRGRKRAICTNFSSTITIREGRFASLSMSFFETPLQIISGPVSDPVSSIVAAADIANSDIKADIEKNYDTKGSPAFSLDSLEAAIAKATEETAKAMAPLVAGAEAAADLQSRVDSIVYNTGRLVLSPLAIYDSMSALYSTAIRAPNIGWVLAEILGRFPVRPDPPFLTPVRQVELSNWDALNDCNRRGLIVAFCKSATEAEFETTNQATEARDGLAGHLLDEMDLATSDDVYRTLGDLRGEILRSLPKVSSKLPTLVRVKTKASTPSLEITYRYYGSVAKELSLVRTNRIKNPLFVPGGEILEVERG